MLRTRDLKPYGNYYVGADIKVGWQTDDGARNIYDDLFRYPSYGVGYYMGNMNGIVMSHDDEQGMGKPAALYAFWSSPMYRSRWWQLRYNISAGLSYNFNAYDPNDNPGNLFIGSNHNAYIGLAFDAALTLPGHSSFLAGLSFQHFSNGSYQKPNKGLNLLSATLTYQWSAYSNSSKGYSRFHIPPYAPAWEANVFWAWGVRMLDTDFDPENPNDGKRWYCTTLSAAALKQINHRRKWGAGLDLFYFSWGDYVLRYRHAVDQINPLRDTAINAPPALVRQQAKETSSFSKNNVALGIFLSHEVGYKRVWLVTDVGFYPFGRVGDMPTHPVIYERLGVKFYITDRLYAGVSIKAHGAKADYTEWTLGFSIRRQAKVTSDQ